MYAHPDDESFGPAAILAKCVARGAELHGLWFTRGEHGRVCLEPAWDPERVARWREPERIARWREQDLHEVAALIGYREVEILGYADGALDRVRQHVLQQDILARLRALAPQIVFTFGPAGITRHRDHRAVHRAAVAAFDRGIAEGIPLRRLYYDAVSPAAALRLGIADELDGQGNTFVDVTEFQHVKTQALGIHARHVVDAAERLSELRQHPLPREALFEARNHGSVSRFIDDVFERAAESSVRASSAHELSRG